MDWPLVLERSFAAWTRSNETSVNDEVLQPYRDGVARIAHLLMCDSGDASEVVRETFLNVPRTIQTHSRDSSIRVSIFRAAVSTIQDRQRWWKRYKSSFGRTSDHAKDEEAVIRYGLSRLPRRYQLILVLRDIEGLSYAEISEVLNIPMATVRSRLTHARTQMLTSVTQQ